MCPSNSTNVNSKSRVPDQNGVSQACYVVEIYHSGLKPLKWLLLHERVSARTGWPGVSILYIGEIASLICIIFLSVAACTVVNSKSRVPDQNGISQACYIVEIHHSGLKPSKWLLLLVGC